jgi:hypothetical protein
MPWRHWRHRRPRRLHRTAGLRHGGRRPERGAHEGQAVHPAGLFLVLAVFLGVGLTLKPREVPSPFIGKPAPAFSLPQLQDAG